MIKIEKVTVYGWEAAIRGLRNPYNSWDRSDSVFDPELNIGPNDLELMKRMNISPEQSKYRRMITVTFDTVAPLYWYKEMDTYKVGTVCDSCSTMHKIHAKEFVLDDFSHEHLFNGLPDSYDENDGENQYYENPTTCLSYIINLLNYYRKKYIETLDPRYWWQMIQLLPSSYNQRRTYQVNYEVLAQIHRQRGNHKLDEWREFCKWIRTLPYSEIITKRSK